MPPSIWRRKWIKLFIDECLTGTIREDLEPEERSTWYDFLLLAGRNRPPGSISANENTPMSRKRLASILNISDTLLARSITKFQESGRIEVTPDGVITIINWAKYQYTDYDRQKPFREKAKERIKAEKIKYYQDESKKRELTREEKLAFLDLFDDEIEVAEPPQTEEDIAREAERAAEQGGAYEPYDRLFRERGLPVPEP